MKNINWRPRTEMNLQADAGRSHRVQQDKTETGVFKHSSTLYRSQFSFRVLDRYGRVIGARSPQMEFWKISGLEGTTVLPNEFEPLDERCKIVASPPDFKAKLIKLWAYLYASILRKMSKLQLQIMAWIFRRLFDEGKGESLSNALSHTGLVNLVKLIIENQTGTIWEWWPFQPSYQPLLAFEFLLVWDCVSSSDIFSVQS